MSERRVTQVLEEWRRLERRLADAGPAAEEAHLRARIHELRAEYQRLTSVPLENDESDSAPDEPVDTVGRLA